MFQLPPPISSPLQTFEHALYSTVVSAMSALLDVQYMHFFMEADHMVLIVIVVSNLFKCGISKVRDKDGAVMTALTSNQCGLLLIPALCHMWVEFDVGSHLARGFFSVFSGFPPSTKTNTGQIPIPPVGNGPA